MTLAEHEQDSINLFGKPFTEVHQWLDHYATNTPGLKFNPNHRHHRHHGEAIAWIRDNWGLMEGAAALRHVKQDLGLDDGMIPFTEDAFIEWEKGFHKGEIIVP